MKINVLLDGEVICELDAEIDYKKAIELGEKIDNTEFNQLLAISILDHIRKGSKDNEQVGELYEILKEVIAVKWQEEKAADSSKDTDAGFDTFLKELVISYIQFIPSFSN